MRATAVSAAVAAALVVTYLALGGASYAPAKAADPCAPREWRDPEDLGRVAEQVVLSALDGAACKLRVSRERIVLAFADRGSLERFARAHGISGDELEELVRLGLLRAVDDAERAGALQPELATQLRDAARDFPVTVLLDLLDQLAGS